MKPPGTPETRILEALSRFEQLTAEQLARHLSYSFRYTQAKCKTLTEGKYLQRLTLPKRTHGGSVPYVYTLGRKGRQYLSRIAENDTLGVKKRYRPSEEQARLHTLATNEVLLQIMQATESNPDLSFVRNISEREFRDDPIKVTLPERGSQKPVSLIPDLWVHVRQRVMDKPTPFAFALRSISPPLNRNAGDGKSHSISIARRGTQIVSAGVPYKLSP